MLLQSNEMRASAAKLIGAGMRVQFCITLIILVGAGVIRRRAHAEANLAAIIF
jgi:hypothetical protein